MTHGQMQVMNCDRTEKVDLYTWHDGHLFDAVELLVELPFLIFDVAKKEQTSRKKGDVVSGHWFYSVYINSLEESFEDLEESFESLIPLQLSVISLANWLVWSRMDKWHVIPSLEWASYPRETPDVSIEVMDERIGSYSFIFRDEDYKKKEVEERVTKILEPYNKRIKLEKNKVTVDFYDAWPDVDGRINVPFHGIVMDLLYQDMEKAKKKVKK